MPFVDVQLDSLLPSNTAGGQDPQILLARYWCNNSLEVFMDAQFLYQKQEPGFLSASLFVAHAKCRRPGGVALTRQGKVTFLISQGRNSSAVGIGVGEAGGL